MIEKKEERLDKLRRLLADHETELAILADPDSIAYFAGYWNYLGMDFGRPTLLIVSVNADAVIITPLMESDMCAQMTRTCEIRPWSDGVADEWRGILTPLLKHCVGKRVAIESRTLSPQIAQHLESLLPNAVFEDVGPLVAKIRMIKSAHEIAIMRQAGQVAVAMVEGAKNALGEGVPEYEVALAVIAAGTRKAAALLDENTDRFTSPTIHNLQVLQSGQDTCLVHRRSSVRRIRKGDPVYLCFCAIANFRNYKLGFDREFFIGSVTDEQARVYETAVAAQQAALAAIRPGVTCESVNAAAEQVYEQGGFSAGYRTGRSIGYSFLEPPELKRGQTTRLEVGMTFAVDGGITISGQFGGRVGDSIVVTDNGFEYLTPFPRELTVL